LLFYTFALAYKVIKQLFIILTKYFLHAYYANKNFKLEPGKLKFSIKPCLC